MKIYIDQIPESGLELNESCEPAALDLDREDIKLSEPITLSAQATKGINNISVNLKADLLMHLKCSRCIEKFTAAKSL